MIITSKHLTAAISLVLVAILGKINTGLKVSNKLWICKTQKPSVTQTFWVPCWTASLTAIQSVHSLHKWSMNWLESCISLHYLGHVAIHSVHTKLLTFRILNSTWPLLTVDVGELPWKTYHSWALLVDINILEWRVIIFGSVPCKLRLSVW